MKILLTAVLMSLSLCATAQATATEEPAKKPVAKKVEPKKAAPPKKVVAKKPAEPNKVTVYKNDPNAPIIRDKDGNVVPTNPGAYDVSSAVGKKK